MAEKMRNRYARRISDAEPAFPAVLCLSLQSRPSRVGPVCQKRN